MRAANPKAAGPSIIPQTAHEDLFSLRGRTAVVTGGLGLLGRQFCNALLSAGANVIVADREVDACIGFAEELNAMSIPATTSDAPPPKAFGHAVDVTNTDSLIALREGTLGSTGRLDILVNSAAIDDKFDGNGWADAARIENYPLDLWQRALLVNLTGTFLSCQVLGAAMVNAGRGSIVNIGSTYGMVGPDQRLYQRADGSQAFWKSPVYAATKGGVLAFTRHVATSWADRGVRCNALCPGGVEAGQDQTFVRNYGARTPLGRMAHANEMQGAVVFLASDASAYMTGANLVVDGGWTAW